jgi:hypothetical protein
MMHQETPVQVQRAEQAAREVERTVNEAMSRAMQSRQVLAPDVVALRHSLQEQLAHLEMQRDQISGQLANPMVQGSNRRGLEGRIESLDARIGTLDQQIGELEASLARSATAQVVGVAPGRGARGGQSSINENEAGMAIGALFMLCVALPLSIAFARRIWRRSAAVVTGLPAEINERLSRMDQHLDAIAVEVERIGEGQRYLTKMHAEQQHLSPGAAERVESPERARDLQRRGS